MQIERNQLIDDLIARVKQTTLSIAKLKALPADQLNRRINAGDWTILECIEHLNLYGDFYLPEIEKQILNKETSLEADEFRSGVIGNYFASLIQVKNGKVKKMKTPKNMNPIHSALSITTIDRFLKQQERLTTLLQQARKIDLTRTKTAISMTSMIRLRLGDTLRFVVFHIERHVAQARRNVEVGA
jgi:hypothetical protein